MKYQILYLLEKNRSNGKKSRCAQCYNLYHLGWFRAVSQALSARDLIYCQRYGRLCTKRFTKRDGIIEQALN